MNILRISIYGKKKRREFCIPQRFSVIFSFYRHIREVFIS
ncbi:hypothetical protein HMPREF9163_00282 [Selenomonas sp. oral taxon 138 str. F0429]|nr:hypothetical protein HMPREF9163_00282 [Selenomonas sp. oral taxon 138 str. F0429]